jgi:periplasmic copper chaperone A
MTRKFAGVRTAAWACGVGFALLTSAAQALFIVNQPWVRPAKSGQSTELYMNLTSTDGATLVDVRTAAAAKVVLRAPGKAARTIAALPLPAGELVALSPGNARVGLQGLQRTLKSGDRIDVTLTIRGADGNTLEVPLSIEARWRSAEDDERRPHHHDH